MFSVIPQVPNCFNEAAYNFDGLVRSCYKKAYVDLCQKLAFKKQHFSNEFS